MEMKEREESESRTRGAPGDVQLVGATFGVQLAPPVSFFSMLGSLEGEPAENQVTDVWIEPSSVFKIQECR
ncbi:hypothetical protein CRUP_018120 [Coryphaenoides rupestris]|nr:hypothetical protein CRUP_018120 [Coryphaenoides rupestris]